MLSLLTIIKMDRIAQEKMRGNPSAFNKQTFYLPHIKPNKIWPQESMKLCTRIRHFNHCSWTAPWEQSAVWSGLKCLLNCMPFWVMQGSITQEYDVEVQLLWSQSFLGSKHWLLHTLALLCGHKFTRKMWLLFTKGEWNRHTSV